MKNRNPNKDLQPVTALVANSDGEIFDLDGFAAVGMAGDTLASLDSENTFDMPPGGELMFLPDRHPILYNLKKETFETLVENPYKPGQEVFPVATFNSPGFVNLYHCAYAESETALTLPLFSYGAAGWFNGGFRSPVMLVDDEPRQDLRYMKVEDVEAGARRMKKKLPGNRLRKHLENCALVYGCPAGKNFFLGRYEAPLPTSPSCNACCLGCLSLQEKSDIPSSQNRIDFIPEPEDIAGVAIAHIDRVPRAVVSFGQGCEGDPLMAAAVIEPAIKIIRKHTADGTIHLNTNGSRPAILKRLFDAGLDSVRISMNSFRGKFYQSYFRPRGYGFPNVVESIDLAIQQEKFVAVNYLNMPGFTDTEGEVEALMRFIGEHPIHMIQWRNLNFDPLRYRKAMADKTAGRGSNGMKNVLKTVRKAFPGLRHGYFNPPKEKW